MKRSGRRGQGMTEYIIIVALVAVAAIGVVTLFSDNMKKLFGASADALAGETNGKNEGKKATGDMKSKTLEDFAEQ